MNKLVTTLSLVVLLSLGAFAHGDNIPLSFSGIVSEKSGGAGIAGAVISIERNGQVIQSTKSDAEGNFKLQIEAPLTRRDQLKLRVQKNGFGSTEHLPVNCRNENLQIELERKIPMPIIKPIGTRGPVYAI